MITTASWPRESGCRSPAISGPTTSACSCPKWLEPDDENTKALITTFLSIGHAAYGDESKPPSAGILKARVLTAARLASAGLDAESKRIESSLHPLSEAARRMLRTELLGDVPEHFWEVTDRQENLDWVPEETRLYVEEIVGRLESQDPAGA